jgi:SWIM zinc finger
MVALAASPRSQSKAHSPAEALLARYADSSIVALSLSRPGTTYRVQLDPLSCECPGFQYRGACYHVAAAAERFGAVEQHPCGNCGRTAPVAELVAPARSWSEYGANPDGRGLRGQHWHCADLAACLAARRA